MSKNLTKILIAFTLPVLFILFSSQIVNKADAKTLKQIKIVKQKDVCPTLENKKGKCNAKAAVDDLGKPLTGTSPLPGSYAPSDFHTAYNLPCTPNGSMQTNCDTPQTFGPNTIGIVIAYDDPTLENDLNVYSTQFGIPSCTKANGCLTIVDQNGGNNLPTNVDGTWSLEESLDAQMAHGLCQTCKILVVEANTSLTSDLSAAENTAAAMGATVISNSWGGSNDTTYDLSFIHPGIAVVAGSGDSGYGQELWPSTIPQVVSVGGTTLRLNTDSSYGSESAWNGTGSACSFWESAAPWQTNLPNWAATGCGNSRATADVSADADPSTGAAIYDSTPWGTSTGWYQVGGTSLATPIISATFALAGGIQPGIDAPSVLYSNFSSANSHDVTSGTNGTCNSILCVAGVGYDGPTGIGTPNGIGGFQGSGAIITPTPTPTPTPSSVPAPDLSTFNQSSTCNSSTYLDTVNFSWGAVPGVSIYEINWDGSSSPKDSAGATVSGNSLSLGNFAGNQAVNWWQVRSYSPNGSSAWTTQAIPFTTVPCGDTIAPTVSITSPTNGSTVTGSVQLQATASDNVGVSSVLFFVDGNFVGGRGTAPYSISWNTSGLTQGSTHVLTAKAYDAAGNIGTSTSVNVTIADTTPPTVSITSPANGAKITGIAPIQTTATDNMGVSNVKFYADGSLIGTATSAPYTFNWNTTGLIQGSVHTLSATATDTSGNVGFSTNISVTILDTTAPTVSISSPSTGSILKNPISISTNANDNVGVTKIELWKDSDTSAFSSCSGSNTCSTSYSFLNGAHTLYAKAYDAAGNVGTSSINFTVDSIAPTVTITSPTTGSYLNNPVTVSASATDNTAVARVEFWKDQDTSPFYTGTSAPYSTAYSFATGQHTLTAKAYDSVGNASTTSTSFNLDNIAPTISITSPANGSKVTGVVSISASAADNAGISNVKFYVDGSLLSTNTTSPYSINWNTAGLTQGSTHTLAATATDLAGNVSFSTNVNVTIADTTAPTVSITNPVDGSQINKGTVLNITANSTDNVAVSKVEFYVNNSLTCTDSTSPYSCSWTVPSGKPGVTYTIMAKAYDNSGNNSTSTVSIKSK